MGGGNSTPSGTEEMVTDGFEERRREDIDLGEVDYIEDSDEETLEDAGEEDSETGIPEFEAFRQGDASLPSEDDESDGERETESESASAAGGVSVGGGGENGIDVGSATETGAANNSDYEGSRSEAERFDVDLSDGISDVRGPQEFAETVLADGVQEDIHPSKEVARAERPKADGESRFGTWREYSEDSVILERPLAKTDAEEGATAAYMKVQDLKGEDCEAYRAFVTDYGHDDDDTLESPDMWQAHAEMTASGFSNMLGIRTPEHTWDDDGEYVAVQGVETPGRGNGAEIVDADTETLQKIDRHEFIDVCAAQALAGNHDQHAGNLYVTEDGSVHCVDYDRAGGEITSRRELQNAAEKPAFASKMVDDKRSDSFEVSEEEIADRAIEIAAALEASGEKKRVRRGLEQYDEKFAEESGKEYGVRILNNITNMAWEAEGDR